MFLQTKNGPQPATNFITVDSAIKLLKLLYLEPNEEAFPHKWGTTNIQIVRTWIEINKLTPAHKSELQIETEDLDETVKVPLVETVVQSDDDSDDGLFDEDNRNVQPKQNEHRGRKPVKATSSFPGKTKTKKDNNDDDDDYEI